MGKAQKNPVKAHPTQSHWETTRALRLVTGVGCRCPGPCRTICETERFSERIFWKERKDKEQQKEKKEEK